jgi:hypothetical protein
MVGYFGDRIGNWRVEKSKNGCFGVEKNKNGYFGEQR